VPAGQERALRRRIRSIRSTQKITRAMELIAASRIVRAQQAIMAARPYAEHMRAVVADISAAPEARGHWVFSGQGQRQVVIVLAADRGLSGAFNVNAMRAAEDVLRRMGRSGPEPTVVAVGRRAQSYFNFRGRAVSSAFEGFSDRPTFEDARRVVGAVREQLERGDVGELHLVSTRFLSVGSQKVEDRRLVPLERPADDGGQGQGHDGGARPADGPGGTLIFEFEPEPDQILDRLLPQWLESEIYTALLESAASFHVAQQRAMKSATDNADDLVTTLQRAMNRARQDSITTEIMEIVGGAEALRHEEDLAEAVRPEQYFTS
jgi:F-type H+-transporting ATPase subunit gamma